MLAGHWVRNNPQKGDPGLCTLNLEPWLSKPPRECYLKVHQCLLNGGIFLLDPVYELLIGADSGTIPQSSLWKFFPVHAAWDARKWLPVFQGKIHQWPHSLRKVSIKGASQFRFHSPTSYTLHPVSEKVQEKYCTKGRVPGLDACRPRYYSDAIFLRPTADPIVPLHPSHPQLISFLYRGCVLLLLGPNVAQWPVAPMVAE